MRGHRMIFLLCLRYINSRVRRKRVPLLLDNATLGKLRCRAHGTVVMARWKVSGDQQGKHVGKIAVRLVVVVNASTVRVKSAVPIPPLRVLVACVLLLRR